MNWKRIIAFAALLFVSQILVGFVDGGYSRTSVAAAWRALALSLCLSFTLSVVVFSALSFRQEHRPFLYALSALLLLMTVSVALVTAFPAWLGGTPGLLVVLDWTALVLALVVGTILGRHMAALRSRARTDA